MSEQTAEEEAPVEEEPALVHGVITSLSRGQLVVHPSRAEYLDLVGALCADGYQMCSDVCGAD
ncbi:MAG: hypothetical protein ACRD12_05120, partial [Acidimicrobiales bacterium]